MTSAEEQERLFVRLYEEHYPTLMDFLRRRTDETTARDVAAETFLVAWRKLDQAVLGDLPWLYRTAGLTLRNSERTERRQRRTAGRLAAEPPLANPDPAGAHAHRSTVLAAVQRLPEADRELLYLVAWEGLDVKSAAAATGRSAGATAVRLHRARARLRRQLGDHPSLPSTVLPEASP